METREVLQDLRKKNDLTQEDMAKKLFVTRQAVSRWETGETLPNVETMKLISKEFNVSVDTILGQPQERICQSCAMPLQSVEEFGTTKDGDLSAEYCVHCYKDGDFTNDRTMEEMIAANLRYLDQWNEGQGTGYTAEEARAILMVHLATLKRWRG
jgi:transcriptional regulator with XRE-family HTH domain